MSTSSFSHAPPPSSHTAPRPHNGHSGSSNPLYSAASRIPLIKSPSVSVPPPIRLPTDLHPLPTDIAAYFVYPFSLESYVLDPNTPSSATIEQLQTRHEEYLTRREAEKEEEKRSVLKRLAPGWAEGGGGVMVPDSRRGAAEADHQGQGQAAGAAEKEEASQPPRAPIDDLVDHLAKLEAMGAKPVGDSTGRS